MTLLLSGLSFAACMFIGLLVCLELGRRWGARQLQRDPEGARLGTGAVEGAVFALLGLLIAFTFSGAAERFDRRRHLIVEEANAIGTAWLRLDVLPAESQPALRELFRQYVDSRLAAYRALPDIEAAKAELDHSLQLQSQIWSQSVAAARASPTPALRDRDAARAERHDRHHYDANRGDVHAPAGRDLRTAVHPRSLGRCVRRRGDGREPGRAARCTCSASRRSWP